MSDFIEIHILKDDSVYRLKRVIPGEALPPKFDKCLTSNNIHTNNTTKKLLDLPSFSLLSSSSFEIEQTNDG